MKTLAKTSQALIVSLVMVMASGAGAARAQPGPGFAGGPGMMGEGPGMMRGDPQERWELMQQRHAQRMQELEKQLNLKPEQQAAWKAFLEAHNAWLQSMHTGWQSWSGAKTTPERFDAMAKLMEQRLPSVQDLAKKAHALYDILDAQQRATLDRFTAWHGRYRDKGRTP